MSEIALMQSGLLNENHPLYQKLKDENPLWWQIVKKDVELYIDIRKKNKIVIYYLGGRMAGVEMTKNGIISVTAHPKYVGYNSKKDFFNPSVYRKRVKDGKVYYDAIYQDCRDWIISKMSDLKYNMRHFYCGEDSGQSTAEKRIQGKLVLNGRNIYLDTEFSHRLYKGERKSVRIDLVKIEDNKLIFVELKRIVDSRLRSRDGQPEILTQMQNYREFILTNQDVLIEYYKKLFTIKKMLDLPVPNIVDVNKLTLDKEPLLIIASNYDKMTPNRQDRINDIKLILSKINVTPIFF